MNDDFMLEPMGQTARRIVAVIIVALVIVVVVGVIYYLNLVGQVAVTIIDQGAKAVVEQVEKDNRAIEEAKELAEFRERKMNREYRELKERLR